MTTPESIVTSLDWSKKLKEAGWPQEEGHFSWYRYSLRNTAKEWYLECRWQNDRNHIGWIDAPTAEEILRRLPRIIEHEGYEVFLVAEPMAAPGWWTVGYLNIAEDPKIAGPHKNANSIANAAAAMYCYLAEQKLLPAAA